MSRTVGFAIRPSHFVSDPLAERREERGKRKGAGFVVAIGKPGRALSYCGMVPEISGVTTLTKGEGKGRSKVEIVRSRSAESPSLSPLTFTPLRTKRLERGGGKKGRIRQLEDDAGIHFCVDRIRLNFLSKTITFRRAPALARRKKKRKKERKATPSLTREQPHSLRCQDLDARPPRRQQTERKEEKKIRARGRSIRGMPVEKRFHRIDSPDWRGASEERKGKKEKNFLNDLPPSVPICVAKLISRLREKGGKRKKVLLANAASHRAQHAQLRTLICHPSRQVTGKEGRKGGGGGGRGRRRNRRDGGGEGEKREDFSRAEGACLRETPGFNRATHCRNIIALLGIAESRRRRGEKKGEIGEEK